MSSTQIYFPARKAVHCDLALTPWPELNSIDYSHVCDIYIRCYLMIIVYTCMHHTPPTCHANIITIVHVVTDRVTTRKRTTSACIRNIIKITSVVWCPLRWCI